MDKEDKLLMCFAVLLVFLCASMGFYTYTINSPQKATANYVIYGPQERKELIIETKPQDQLR